MAETTAQNKIKEITTEDILAAYQNGIGSEDWEEILKAKDLSSAAESLRSALVAGETVLEYQKQIADNYGTDIQDIKDKASRMPRGSSQIFNSENGSVALKDDGTISFAAGTVSHLELDPGGNLTAENVATRLKTNFLSVDADDIVVNNHKLNQKIYELADYKKVYNVYDGSVHIAGNLTMLGTVLVKAWEPNLQRYVLVRRQINIPVFSPSIGGAEVNPGLNITPDTEFIRKFRSTLNQTGISSYSDLMSTLQAKRAADIINQEKATAEKNEEIKKENEAKQATSMTSLTGQDPATVGASRIVVGTIQHGGGGGDFTGDKSVRYDGTANDMAKEAWSEAQRIAKDLNVDPTIIYGQWYHESGGFSSKLAMENRNLGGLTQTTPNGAENKQPDGGNYYMVFKSIRDYAEYFKRIWGPDIKGVSSAEQYALKLKQEGYYGDSYQNYVAGIYGGMKHIPSSLA